MKSKLGREIRQIIYNQLNMTKESIREEINKAIVEQVNIVLNDKEVFQKTIEKIVHKKFEQFLTGTLNPNEWQLGRSSDKKIESIIQSEISEKVRQKVLSLFEERVNFDVKVSHKTKKKVE